MVILMDGHGKTQGNQEKEPHHRKKAPFEKNENLPFLWFKRIKDNQLLYLRPKQTHEFSTQ